MADVDLKPLAPRDAIAALQARGRTLHPSFAWQDVWQETHAALFTVAKSAGHDVLRDIHAALVTALAEGRTVRQFADELEPLLKAKGWWGRGPALDPETGETVPAQLGSRRRLKTIFNVNMRVSYAAGQWASFERNKAVRPWLRYVAILDRTTRPEHAALHDTVLSVDDPAWSTWAPPLGWNCRCTLQSLSARDLERMGDRAKRDAPAAKTRDWTNRRTGEVVQVPEGIDPGWGHNPGRQGAEAARRAAEKLADLPPSLASAAVRDPTWPAKALSEAFGDWLDRVLAKPHSTGESFTVGALPVSVTDFLSLEGVPMTSAAVTISDKAVFHILRDSKANRGRGISAAELRGLPASLQDPLAMLWDRGKDEDGRATPNTDEPTLLYVFSVAGQKAKLVVRIGYPVKRRVAGGRVTERSNAIVSAGLVSSLDLKTRVWQGDTLVPRYIVIAGVLD